MNYISKPDLKAQKVKQLALKNGFEACGISTAAFLERQAPLLETWLKHNYQGQMAYMSNHFDQRLDPRKLVDGAKSVISLLYNYFPPEHLPAKPYKISKYAYGNDYHEVIKKKLKTLLSEMKIEMGDFSARVFVDSAPVMDKVWAEKSGLGWVGKHSNLINRSMGSFFFIAEIISDLELSADMPVRDYCGSCTRCVTACPTGAIVEPYVVDGSKCISYLTIELKEEIPVAFQSNMENWIFGCDICQDVCPWNRFAKPHHEPTFLPSEELKNFEEWEELNEVTFSFLFKKSAIKRTKFEGLRRNITFVKGGRD